MKAIPTATHERILELRVVQRYSLGQIANATGVSRTTIARIVAEHPLSDAERKECWASQMKGRKRKPDGRLESGPDLTNQKFGRLTAIQRIYSNSRHPKWECKCDCGNTAIVRTDVLVHGTTKSCGCFARDMARARLQKDPESVNLRSLYASYRSAAQDRSFEFHLTEAQCKDLFSGQCFYCGIEPSQKRMVHGNIEAVERQNPYLYNGIDRLNSDLGYTTENCVSCCTKCNRAKGNMPLAEFFAWLDRIVEYQLARKKEA